MTHVQHTRGDSQPAHPPDSLIDLHDTDGNEQQQQQRPQSHHHHPSASTDRAVVAGQHCEIRADPWRFVVAPIFVVLSISNAMQWIAFSPIVDEVRTYFHMNATQVNFLATTYVIAYVAIVFLSCKLYEVTGIKLGLVVAALANAIGATVKIIALYAWPNAALLYIAQVFNSFTEVLTIATPPLIANRWFPENERMVANTVLSSALNFGCGIGVLIPTFFVGPEKQEKHHFGNFFWFHFGLCAAMLVLTVFLFPKKPRYSASYAAAHQQNKEEERLKALDAVLHRHAATTSSTDDDISENEAVSQVGRAAGNTMPNEPTTLNSPMQPPVKTQAPVPPLTSSATTSAQLRHRSSGEKGNGAPADLHHNNNNNSASTSGGCAPSDEFSEEEEGHDNHADGRRGKNVSNGVESGRAHTGAADHSALGQEHSSHVGVEEEFDADNREVEPINIFSVIMDCVRQARHNLSFVLLSVASAAELGLIWAVATVLPQMLSPYGVSEAISGWIGFLNLVLGTVVCPFFMPLVEKYGRRYRLILCTLAVVLVINMVLLTLLLHFGPAVVEEDQKYYVIVAFVCWGGVAGLCQNFMMPLMFEYVVELTFPMAESTSAPMLTWSACLMNFILALVFGEVLTDDPDENRALRVFIGATVVTVAGAVALFFTKPMHRRRDYEQRKREEEAQMAADEQAVLLAQNEDCLCEREADDVNNDVPRVRSSAAEVPVDGHHTNNHVHHHAKPHPHAHNAATEDEDAAAKKSAGVAMGEVSRSTSGVLSSPSNPSKKE